MPHEDFAGIHPRAIPGQAFGGVAEISAANPDLYVIGPATDISLKGCFVRAGASLRVGAKVKVRITYAGYEFSAPSEVAYAVPQEGIGIAFDATSPEDRKVLEAWLR